MSKISAVISLAVVASFSLAACGGAPAAMPTAPSGGTTRSATIVGVVDDGSGSTSLGSVAASSRHAGITVTVVETGQTTQTDGSGQFVVTAPAGTVTLRFQGRGVDASLQIGGLVAGQTLTITVQVSGSHARMGQGHDGEDEDGDGGEGSCFAPGAKAEVEGLVSAMDPDSITVRQQGKGEYRCLVSAETRIRKGNRSLTLEDLAVGNRVHVKGTGLGSAQAPCDVAASEIKLQ